LTIQVRRVKTMPLLPPVNIAEAKARLPELVERAARGEEIVIARNGEPRARLVPLPAVQKRVPGKGVGRWQVSEDFDAPLPAEWLEAFEGRDRG
jgi:prevent-host-death family protein